MLSGSSADRENYICPLSRTDYYYHYYYYYYIDRSAYTLVLLGVVLDVLMGKLDSHNFKNILYRSQFWYYSDAGVN